MKVSRSAAAVALALFDLIDARFADYPLATASVELALDGWTPRPTAAPELLRSLRKRQIDTDDDNDDDEDTTVYFAPDQTCGYVSGRPGAQFTCSIGYQCVLFTASASLTGNVACCNTETCGVRLACVNYEEYYSSSACDDGCNLDAYTLKCTDTAMPYCNTVSMTSDIYDFWCNNVDLKTVQSATTAYSGQTGRSFSPFALTENASTTNKLDLEPDTTAAGPDITGDSDSDDDDDNDSDNDDNGGSGGSGGSGRKGGSSDNGSNDNDDDGGSSTPIGPIVGGVVGGVAAIGLGALGLWLFFRNKKKKQAAADNATVSSPSVAPTYQQSPPPNMAQQPYNPHQSYYDPKFAAAVGAQQYQPYPQQHPQQQQPGGFYAMGNAPPGATATSSPTMTHHDPNVSSPTSAAYPSGFSQSPPPPTSSVSPNPQGAPAYHQQPGGGGFVHEAPSRPDEMHRGGVHEMG